MKFVNEKLFVNEKWRAWSVEFMANREIIIAAYD